MSIESVGGRTRPPITIETPQKAEMDNEKKVSIKSAEKDDDSIEITAIAQGITQAFKSVSSDTTVDVERVTEIKKALANGSYQINAGRIAEKMLQHEMLMSQDQRA